MKYVVYKNRLKRPLHLFGVCASSLLLTSKPFLPSSWLGSHEERLHQRPSPRPSVHQLLFHQRLCWTRPGRVWHVAGRNWFLLLSRWLLKEEEDVYWTEMKPVQVPPWFYPISLHLQSRNGGWGHSLFNFIYVFKLSDPFHLWLPVTLSIILRSIMAVYLFVMWSFLTSWRPLPTTSFVTPCSVKTCPRLWKHMDTISLAITQEKCFWWWSITWEVWQLSRPSLIYNLIQVLSGVHIHIHIQFIKAWITRSTILLDNFKYTQSRADVLCKIAALLNPQ